MGLVIISATALSSFDLFHVVEQHIGQLQPYFRARMYKVYEVTLTLLEPAGGVCQCVSRSPWYLQEECVNVYLHPP
jgi:hypothetical protein